MSGNLYEDLNEAERLELAKHIAAQGDEAGFDAETIAEAERLTDEAVPA